MMQRFGYSRMVERILSLYDDVSQTAGDRKRTRRRVEQPLGSGAPLGGFGDRAPGPHVSKLDEDLYPLPMPTEQHTEVRRRSGENLRYEPGDQGNITRHERAD